MGVKFTCPRCGRRLNVKSSLAGKRGVCPHCHDKVDIPTQSNPEATEHRWYVMPAGANAQYGPATDGELRQWVGEGRVTADAMLWREDWPQWQPASAIFPQLPVTGGSAPRCETAGPMVGLPVAAGTAPPTTTQSGAAWPTEARALASAPVAVAVVNASGIPTASATAPVWPANCDAAPVVAAPLVPPVAALDRYGRVNRYRRSNTGAIIAIVFLVALLIPLSIVAWHVVFKPLNRAGEKPMAGAAAEPINP